MTCAKTTLKLAVIEKLTEWAIILMLVSIGLTLIGCSSKTAQIQDVVTPTIQASPTTGLMSYPPETGFGSGFPQGANPSPLPDDWVEFHTIGFRKGDPKFPKVIFINTHDHGGIPSDDLETPNVWHKVKVSDFGVPADTKEVFLNGLLVITHGTTQQICNLTVAFRAPGSELNCDRYLMQADAPTLGSGPRQNASTWTPVVNGEVEFCWRRSTFGDWPESCSYAINLSAQAYAK